MITGLRVSNSNEPHFHIMLNAFLSKEGEPDGPPSCCTLTFSHRARRTGAKGPMHRAQALPPPPTAKVRRGTTPAYSAGGYGGC